MERVISMVNSDGQLYKIQSERFSPPAPSLQPESDCDSKLTTPALKKHRKSLFSSISQDEIIILAIIFLVVTGSDDVDMMLILALIYILMDF